MASLGVELKRLASSSVVLLLPTIVARGLNFLLMPVYTRVMTPADYGITGLASTLTPLLSTVLGLGVHVAINRMHFQYKDPEERSRMQGTLMVFLVIAPLIATIALHLVGVAGGLEIFKSVTFQEHLVLVLWAGYLGIFPNIVTNLYVVREQSGRAAVLNVFNIVALVVCTLVFVVGLRQGAVGQLRATLIASAVTAVVSILVTLSNTGVHFYRPDLVRALIFGLPLVPHQIADWGLAASDRVILERFVDKSALGIYSLGYTFGVIAAVVHGAVNRAFYPIIQRKLTDDPQHPDVPRLGTAALGAVTVVCLGVALLSREAIEILTPPQFHAASDIAPWIVLGGVFQSMYQIWSQGTLYSGKTAGIPLMTGLAAATNIGLNLWLVPKFGIVAAAWTTVLAYLILALAHGLLSQRNHAISWQYGRWIMLIASAVGVYALGQLAREQSWVVRVAINLLLSAVLYPLAVFYVALDEANRERVLIKLRLRKANAS